MKKNALLGFLAAMMFAGTAFAAAQQAPLPTFQALDANRDGVVSREEAKGQDQVVKLFETADANQDNLLDPAEYAAVVKAEGKRQ